MRTIVVRPELREAIARAIVEDEGRQDGEHLYDGERIVFYCPMQAPNGRSDLDPFKPHVPVRALLPAGLRVPTVADYLAQNRPHRSLATLDAQDRRALLQAYEADTIAYLAAALPESVAVEH